MVWIQAEPGADLSAIERWWSRRSQALLRKPATPDELAIALNDREMSFLTDLEAFERAGLAELRLLQGEDFGPVEDIARYRA